MAKGGAWAAWRERMRRYERLGLTVARFCEQEGVSAPSFYRKRPAHPVGLGARKGPARGWGAKRCRYEAAGLRAGDRPPAIGKQLAELVGRSVGAEHR
jgi:hypothetical protein